MTGFKIFNQANHVNRKNLLTHKGVVLQFDALAMGHCGDDTAFVSGSWVKIVVYLAQTELGPTSQNHMATVNPNPQFDRLQSFTIS